MASFEKRGKTWRFKVHYIDDQKNKKCISKSGFKTKVEAKRAAVEVENSLNKGMQENNNYLLDEWLEYYLKTWRNDKLSQSTIEIKNFSKKRVMKFYGNIPIKKSHLQNIKNLLMT